ncbi:MAG: VOC family protein [Desulfobacteraceae bacterium]|nr:MAG: VOC family protein [Desulfobacteraceae bacterium]
MSKATIVFDHVHLVSTDPNATASWYVDKLGGKITGSGEVGGAPQIYVTFEGAVLIVRGERPGERATGKQGLTWGADHFGFHVQGDFDGFCDNLKSKGVVFTRGPVDFSPSLRLAFIEAPDGVSIELLQRRG